MHNLSNSDCKDVLSEVVELSQITSLGPFERNPKIAVGVSGGADSLALTMLLKRWVDRYGGTLVALTVDHKLRKDSSQEAKSLNSFFKEYQITHHILEWSDEKPEKNIQAEARKKRYQLMIDWCEKNKYFHLFLGHHLDDQIETFFLNLARGSGVNGLAAMSIITNLPQLRLLRPFLNLPKSSLIRYLKSLSLSWIEDPTNSSLVYKRNKLRSAFGQITSPGHLFFRMKNTFIHLNSNREIVDEQVADCIIVTSEVNPLGFYIIDINQLKKYKEDIVLRALGTILKNVGGRDYPPRYEALKNYFNEIEDINTKTLSGCYIIKKNNNLFVLREWSLIEEEIFSKGKNDSFLWDNRFQINAISKKHIGKKIIPLGQIGTKNFLEKHFFVKDLNYPKKCFWALPCLVGLDGSIIEPQVTDRWELFFEVEKKKIELFFSPKNVLIPVGLRESKDF